MSQELRAEGQLEAAAERQGLGFNQTLSLVSAAAFAAYATGHLAALAAASDAEALTAAGAALRKRRRALASHPDSVSTFTEAVHLLSMLKPRQSAVPTERLARTVAADRSEAPCRHGSVQGYTSLRTHVTQVVSAERSSERLQVDVQLVTVAGSGGA